MHVTRQDGSGISRAIGYRPIKINPNVKRACVSTLLAVPISITVLILTSNAASDVFRYVLSPGTMFAFEHVRSQSCRGVFGCFVAAVGTAGEATGLAFELDILFYGLLIFGIMTTASAISRKSN